MNGRESGDDVVVAMFTTEELTAAQRAAVVDLSIAAHETDEFRKLFTVYIPSGGRHFLAYRGAELVSHAVVTTRGAQPEGQPVLRTAFVDAVGTLPAYQGRGYSERDDAPAGRGDRRLRDRMSPDRP